MFYETETINLKDENTRELDFTLMQGARAETDILDPKAGKVIVKKGKKITKLSIKKFNEAKIKALP
jgi:DNA-directed RNA polymerase subunit beta